MSGDYTNAKFVPDGGSIERLELWSKYQRLAHLAIERRAAVRFIERIDKDIDAMIAEVKEVNTRLDAIARGEQ